MNSKKVVRLYTTSNISTDQRVQRTANTWLKNGYQTTVICRRQTIKEKTFDFNIEKLSCFFKKSPLFYFFYNLKVIVNITFSKVSVIYANDLDTLVGCSIGAIIRFKPLIYDSHELFTEIPELIGHPIKKFIWKMSEAIFIKRARYIITVSEGVSKELKKRYGINPIVIRNVSAKVNTEAFKDKQPTLIYQGSLNVGRGIELAIDMMEYLPCYHLIIAGSGDIEIELRKRMLEKKLFDRIEFTGVLDADNLHILTCKAWIGLSLEEDLGLNYRYALPNKIFDYVAASVPVLVSNLPDMSNLVNEYQIGLVAPTRNPKELADFLTDFIDDKQKYDQTLANLSNAANKLTWSKESEKLIEIIKSINKPN
ncbi:MAG TPA: glycosyltransferase [Tenuifilaceae bacterium]|nr:glycosyltransferase [Tenuifilaceae bacterium]